MTTWFGRVTATLSVSVWAYAGSRADLVSTGAAKHTLFGQAGSDILNGNDGPDTLFCGNGIGLDIGSLGVDIAVGCETVFSVP